MAEIKDTQLIGVEGAIRPQVEAVPSIVQPKELVITPISTINPTAVEPIETHPVGKQINAQIEAGVVGKDSPDLEEIDPTSGASWAMLFANKKPGAEIVE